MTGASKKERPLTTSLRIPADLVEGIEKIQANEHIDRTHVIIKAIEYWVKVDGKVTADGEYLTRLKNIEETLQNLTDTLQKKEEEIARLQEIIRRQTETIDTLRGKIPTKD